MAPGTAIQLPAEGSGATRCFHQSAVGAPPVPEELDDTAAPPPPPAPLELALPARPSPVPAATRGRLSSPHPATRAAQRVVASVERANPPARARGFAERGASMGSLRAPGRTARYRGYGGAGAGLLNRALFGAAADSGA